MPLANFAKAPRAATFATPALPALVVFAHLRWDFVWQRPQHLLSRLARYWRVVYVEEPQHDPHAPAAGRLQVREVAPNVTVLAMHTRSVMPGFADDTMPALHALLDAWLRRAGMRHAVAWFYTPMALPLLSAVAARAVVYDCMDELSAFHLAPPQLRAREHALMQRADLVLTGGPSLYAARRSLHANCHCLPSAIDAQHYDPARLDPRSALAARADALQGKLTSPRLGYFGVIDERLAPDIVAAMAQARPQWQIVMVGPVVKIDAASLPRAPNIHWLGMQDYALLPYLLAGWDVCLMPFARNASTRFISPTKTLEYMAGGKPVVSTPIEDVARLYGTVVRCADDAGGFIAACTALLAQDAVERRRHRDAMRAVVARHSWDTSAMHVQALIDAVLAPAPVPVRRSADVEVALAGAAE